MSQTDQTASEVFDSLTGFDEMSITQHFGRPISELVDDSSMFGRALVFVLKRRDGANDDDARNAALEMTLKAVSGYFAEESQESGKDENSSESQPMSSPTGASEPVALVRSI